MYFPNGGGTITLSDTEITVSVVKRNFESSILRSEEASYLNENYNLPQLPRSK